MGRGGKVLQRERKSSGIKHSLEFVAVACIGKDY
jgi:hypothetical protein